MVGAKDRLPSRRTLGQFQHYVPVHRMQEALINERGFVEEIVRSVLQEILEVMGEAQETRETTKEVTPLHATV